MFISINIHSHNKKLTYAKNLTITEDNEKMKHATAILVLKVAGRSQMKAETYLSKYCNLQKLTFLT